ncbi:hypothetical protein VTK73DRAFT_3582 [Phialemonium thermophilum]|uniref:Uncharacterized protein n=1 Tax=Phialemonium thermophilum TaxID=223376 RepID=A0ABR3VHD4_9PEZI
MYPLRARTTSLPPIRQAAIDKGQSKEPYLACRGRATHATRSPPGLFKSVRFVLHQLLSSLVRPIPHVRGEVSCSSCQGEPRGGLAWRARCCYRRADDRRAVIATATHWRCIRRHENAYAEAKAGYPQQPGPTKPLKPAALYRTARATYLHRSLTARQRRGPDIALGAPMSKHIDS